MSIGPNRSAALTTVDTDRDSRSADIEFGALGSLLGYHLRRAQVATYQNFARVLDGWNISPGQIGVLALVQANSGINQTRIGNALGIDRSTLVAVIDRLEERDLIARTPSPTDRRSHALVLTKAGERYLAELLPHVHDHERQIASKLSDDERATLISLLGRVGSV
ncbi:MAG: MarR family transcriptional regulator [Alphaproteobacteria bacterium]|nr:MarR family transcriptional regulator [Alphaproteobacteria bacterium]